MPNLDLKRFMVFDSNKGDKGLLYHWTKEAPDNKASLTEQIDDVCLCDASINVSQLFNVREDVNDLAETKNETNRQHDSKTTKQNRSLSLTFEKTIVLIVEVESKQSIWMAAHVASIDNEQNHPQQIDIPIDAIERFICNTYNRFCLLNGTFSMIKEQSKNVCQKYFDKVLQEVHLNSIISNVASLYNYILYLDINPLTLMKVNSFINHLVCINMEKIRHTIVIFNDQLLWSSLSMYDTRLLYNYLVSVLIRDALQEELSTEVDKVRRIEENMPIYLTDDFIGDSNHSVSQDWNKSTTSSETIKISSESLEKFYITVFRSSNNMTLGIILNEPDQNDLIQKCEQVLTSDIRVGVIPLASLAQSVGQNFLKANSTGYSSQSQNSQSSQQNAVAAAAATSNSSSVSSGWRRSSASGATSLSLLKTGGGISNEQKYVLMNRLNVSISWPLSMDMQNKEHLLSTQHDNIGVDSIQQSSLKKPRLLKYLIELEPELRDINRQYGSLVEEFYGKTLNDSWLTVTNSKYRTIYSVHNVRNSGLTEADQSASILKSSFANIRP